MTNDNASRRVYTKRSLAQRAAEAKDKATRLQDAADRQRVRCLIEIGSAFVAVFRTLEKKNPWLDALATTEVRNKRRRTEAMAWLYEQLGLPQPAPAPAADAPTESKAPADATPPAETPKN